MLTKALYTGISEKFLIFLFVMSMLLTKDIKAADFPIYSLLLLYKHYMPLMISFHFQKQSFEHYAFCIYRQLHR